MKIHEKNPESESLKVFKNWINEKYDKSSKTIIPNGSK
jgi:hypothetical protein